MDYVIEHVRPLTNMLDVCLTLEPSFSTLEDLAFLEVAESAHLLGREFATKEIETIRAFSRSLLWFTYRRNWEAPIGGFGGPTSDRGWGCMIRCGQMLLAQCLSLIHLGPEWRWTGNCAQEAGEEPMACYRRLLRMFQDKRTAQFSIHQIAQMGVSEGKQLGDWLGPNTMGQVLKKLVVYDEWSRLVVHVAMDNVLISSDVQKVATQKSAILVEKCGQKMEENGKNKNSEKSAKFNGSTRQENFEGKKSEDGGWQRPLLLIVPLRLGLTAINACYLQAVVEFFKLPQCVGILGGRPNHAVYFYGSVGKKLLYLDPHVCQEFQDLDISETSDTTTQSSPSVEAFPDNLLDQSLKNHQNADELSAHELMDSSIVTIGTKENFSNGQILPENGNALPPTLVLSSNTSVSPYCSNSSSCSSLDPLAEGHEPHHQNGTIAAGNVTNCSYPTSSSMSKLSSSTSSSNSLKNADSTGSEPEMPVDPVMDRFIDSFAQSVESGAEHDGETLERPKEEFGEQFEFSFLGEERKKGEETVGNGLAEANGQKSPSPLPSKGNGSNEASGGSASRQTQASFDDSSFHCPYLLAMEFTTLDPSLALGFLVRDSEDYQDLVHRLKTTVLPSSSPPLFEVLDERPKGWPEFAADAAYLQDESLNIKEYDDLQYDSDEQFELLE